MLKFYQFHNEQDHIRGAGAKLFFQTEDLTEHQENHLKVIKHPLFVRASQKVGHHFFPRLESLWLWLLQRAYA
jgi:multimeric flavodoxin WrbA